MVAVYKYTSDNGNTYQVYASDEFAIPLGYQAAAGTEPYLPTYIAPRYVALQHISLPLFATAFVMKPATISTLPSQIVNSEGTWNVVGFVGEKRLADPSGLLLVAAGPQGPKGDAGANASISAAEQGLAADVTLGTGPLYTSLCTTGALAAGTYLVFVRLQLLTVTAGRIDFEVTSSSGSAAGGSETVPASTWRLSNCTGLITVPASGTITLRAISTVTNTVAKKTDATGSASHGTFIDYAKIA